MSPALASSEKIRGVMMSPAPVFCIGIHKAFHRRSVQSPMECNGPPCLHAPTPRVTVFIMWRYEVHF